MGSVAIKQFLYSRLDYFNYFCINEVSIDSSCSWYTKFLVKIKNKMKTVGVYELLGQPSYIYVCHIRSSALQNVQRTFTVNMR